MAIENSNVNAKEALGCLKKELEPALRAKESDYIIVTADDVIIRNIRSSAKQLGKMGRDLK